MLLHHLHKRFGVVGSAIALIIRLGGCGSTPGSHGPSAFYAKNQRLGLLLRLQYTPDPAVALKPIIATVTVKNREGQTIKQVSGTVILTMTDMSMPSVQGDLTPQNDGRFQARVIPTMGGPWQLAAHLIISGRKWDPVFRLMVVN